MNEVHNNVNPGSLMVLPAALASSPPPSPDGGHGGKNPAPAPPVPKGPGGLYGKFEEGVSQETTIRRKRYPCYREIKE